MPTPQLFLNAVSDARTLHKLMCVSGHCSNDMCHYMHLSSSSLMITVTLSGVRTNQPVELLNEILHGVGDNITFLFLLTWQIYTNL